MSILFFLLHYISRWVNVFSIALHFAGENRKHIYSPAKNSEIENTFTHLTDKV
jgi:hypothetical protein